MIFNVLLLFFEKKRGCYFINLCKISFNKRVNWKVFYDFPEEISPIGDNKEYRFDGDNSRVHATPNKRMEAKLPSNVISPKYYLKVFLLVSVNFYKKFH